MQHTVYDFGGFSLDVTGKRLLLNGNAVSLQPKVFEVLVTFLERNGQLISHDELLRIVWPDAFVDDTSLRTCIHNLRKILQNDPSSRAVIETIPKRGYRFSADVTVRTETVKNGKQFDETQSATNETGETPALTVLSAFTGRKGMLALSILLVASIVLLGFAWQRYGATSTKTVFGFDKLAVLPFTPVGDDNEAIQGGLTDALITNVSKIKQFKVFPLNSVRKYIDQDLDAVAAGRELGADGVLAGTYRIDNDSVRVTASILSVANGETLWEETLTVEKKSAAELEQTISLRLARLISLKQDEFEERNSLDSRNLNPQAVDNYLTARRIFTTGDLKRREEMIVLLKKSIELEPGWPLAYSALAESLIAEDTQIIDWNEAERTAQKAIELDGSLSVPHHVLAEIYRYRDWDWEKAENKFRHAIELDSNNARAYFGYSNLLRIHRRFAEAEAAMKRAVELDPFSPVYHASLSELYRFDGKSDLAVTPCKAAEYLAPKFWRAPKCLFWLYYQKNMFAELGELITRDMSQEQKTQTPWVTALQNNDLKPYFQNALDENKRRHLSQPRSLTLALLHLALGDKENALAYLEQAVEAERSQNAPLINADPIYDPIRNEPRFVALIQKMGLQR